MPRPERPIAATDGTVQRFAAGLRELRERAGNPGYREMASRCGYSVTALSDAAGGRRMPGLRVALAYVESCGGEVGEWEARWRQCSAELAVLRQESADDRPREAPYQGLAHFEAGDAERFFGRAAFVQEVVQRLSRTRFLTVFGPSGSGKSSILRAGLIPEIRHSGMTTVVFTPGSQPLRALADHCQPGGVVIVDQFEEVFTQCHDSAERDQFVSRLLDLASAAETTTQVVLAVRSDFFASCAQHPRLAASLADSTILVGPMNDDELQQAVTGPARLAGLTVERALLTQVLADAKGQPGALPMFSHALMETWRLRRTSMLTLADYLAAGGISGAIARTAEQLYEEFDDHQRTIVRQILIRLTTLGEGTEDTRRRVADDELDLPGAKLVISRLVEARLVITHDSYVEIAHEALITAWPRLHTWLTEDREGLRLHRQLTEAAAQWENHAEDHSLLYRGNRLSRINDWVRRSSHRDTITAVEQEFLRQSLTAEVAEARAAERRTRQRRLLTTCLAFALALVVIAAAIAVGQWRHAVEQTNLATSRHLAVEALSVAPADVAQAMRLSLAAYGTEPTLEARSALLSLAGRHAYTSRLSLAEAPKDLAFNADGTVLATAGQDGQIILWDSAHRVEKSRLTDGHRGAVRSIAISGHLLASGGRDGVVVLWDLTTGQRLLRLLGGWTRVSSVAFSPDGRVIAASGEQGVVHLWAVPDGKSLGELPEPGSARSSLAFSPDGHELAVAGTDQSVRIWNLTQRRPIATLQVPMATNIVAFAPDGQHIAIGGQAPDIVMWDIVSGHQTTLRDHTGYVRSLAFDADGTTLVSGGNDEYAVIWDVATGRPVTRLTGHASELYAVAISPDGRTIASASRDSSVLIYDRGTMPIAGHVDNVTSVAVSPDGHLIASASRDTTISVWDASTRRRLTVLRGHSARVTDVAFDPTQHLIASTSDDRTVRLWDAATFTAVRTLTAPQPSGSYLTVAFNQDGTRLATGGDDNIVRIWDPATGKQIRQEKYADRVLRVAFTNGGRSLVVVVEAGIISVEDLAGGAKWSVQNDATIASAAITRDGSLLAVGENHGEVVLWDMAQRTSATLPQVHVGTVSALAFSPNGRQLASGSMDKTVQLWDIGSRQPWATLTGHDFDVLTVAWSPDGHLVYSSGSDRTVTRWFVRPDEAADALCAALAMDLRTSPSPACA